MLPCGEGGLHKVATPYFSSLYTLFSFVCRQRCMSVCLTVCLLLFALRVSGIFHGCLFRSFVAFQCTYSDLKLSSELSGSIWILSFYNFSGFYLHSLTRKQVIIGYRNTTQYPQGFVVYSGTIWKLL